MNKILFVLIGIVFLPLALLVITPTLIDVDQYRPFLVKTANQYLNGHLSVGKLSLSLWGQIRIQINGIQLTDLNGKTILQVQDAYFHMPIKPILEGSPRLSLKLEKPELFFTKTNGGQINLFSVIKLKAKQKPEPIVLPAVIAQSELDIDILHASLNTQDEKNSLNTPIKDLSLHLKNISLNQNTDFDLHAQIDSYVGQSVKLNGPFSLTGELRPVIHDSEISGLHTKLDLNLSALEISVPQIFKKASGTPTRVQTSIEITDKTIVLKDTNLQLHNLIIQVDGNILNDPTHPFIHLQFSSNKVDFSSWQTIIPFFLKYDPQGYLSFDAKVDGPSNALNYESNFKISKLSLKIQRIKERLETNASIRIETDQIKNLKLAITAPDNHLEINGSLHSFNKPEISLRFSSSGLDLDRLLTDQAEQKDQTTGLKWLSSIGILKNSSAKITGQISSLKYSGIKIEKIKTKLSISDLLVNLEELKMNLLGGSIIGSASMNFSTLLPSYKMKFDIKKLDLRKEAKGKTDFLKNTFIGIFSTQITGEGSGADLTLHGKMHVSDASFTTIDIPKIAIEALNYGLEKTARTIPQASGNKLKPIPPQKTRYKSISGDFTIKDGKFASPRLTARAEPDFGLDLQGPTRIGLHDQALHAEWMITDTHNLTKAKDLSIKIDSLQIENIFSKKGEPVRVPVKLDCTLQTPCYSYPEAPVYLTGVALTNIAEAAKKVHKPPSKTKKQGK